MGKLSHKSWLSSLRSDNSVMIWINLFVTIQVDGTAALYSFLNRGRRTSLFLTDL